MVNEFLFNMDASNRNKLSSILPTFLWVPQTTCQKNNNVGNVLLKNKEMLKRKPENKSNLYFIKKLVALQMPMWEAKAKCSMALLCTVGLLPCHQPNRENICIACFVRNSITHDYVLYVSVKCNFSLKWL